jgi:galactose mutarotase-like enzyme
MESVYDFRTESYGELGGVGWRRLRGNQGLASGVEVIVLDNGLLRMEVVPTRGMGIRRVRVPGGPRLGWDSPVLGPVHPRFIRLEEEGGTGWLRGFDEWLVRCGLFSNGAPCEDAVETPLGGRRPTLLPLHGRIANLPARAVNFSLGDDGSFALSGSVREAVVFGSVLRLTTTVRMFPGAAGFSVEDTVTNLGGRPSEFQLLYHLNFGRPLLEAGARLVAPIAWLQARDEVARRGLDEVVGFGPPTAGAYEQVYYAGMRPDAGGKVPVVLRDASGATGCRLVYEARQLPCFTLWKYLASEAEGYVVGLEPGTNYPNPRPFERGRGRVPVLAPGESFTTTLRFDLLLEEAAVGKAEAEVEALVAGRPLATPPEGLSPDESLPELDYSF